MTHSLAIREATGMPAVQAIAQHFVKSGFFQDTRDLSQAVVKIMAGAEMGFGPFASMKGVHIIKGQTAISAGLMAAAISRGGKYRYRIRSHTDQECSIEFFEGKESLGVASFSVKEAERADLTANPTWKRYPADMVFARAMSRGARRYCADIFAGAVYTPEELGADVDADGAPVAPVAPVIRMVASEARAVPTFVGTDRPHSLRVAADEPPVVVQPAQRPRSREVPEGKRWSEAQLAWFWASLGDLRPRVTGDELHAILGVESIHAWPGDLDAALALVREARAARLFGGEGASRPLTADEDAALERERILATLDADPPEPPGGVRGAHSAPPTLGEAEDEESLGSVLDHPDGSIEREWQRYNAVAKLALAWNKDYPEQPVKWNAPERDGTAAHVRGTAEGLERRLSKLRGVGYVP